MRGFTEETRSDYVRNVRAFAAFIGRSPDTATAEDLRRFQLHQTQSGMQPPSINSAVAALRFFFTVTLDRPDLARRLTVVREPRRLPAVLSVEEVTLLLQAAPGRSTRRRSPPPTAPDCASPRWSRSRSAISTPSACCCGSSRARAARTATPCCRRSCSSCCATGGREGRRRGVVAAAGLAVSGPQPDRAALDPSAQPRRPRRRRGRRDQEASVAAHAAAQLRHPPAGTGHRHPRHPGAARNNDKLPTNTRSRGGSTIRSIPGAARPY